MNKENRARVVIFDEPYPPEKIREGIGVNYAYASGACNSFPYLPDDESNRAFRCPKDAAYMKHAKSLRGEMGK